VLHRTFVCLLAFTFLASVGTIQGQDLRVNSRNLGHRVIAVVPLMGAGTQADPKRPLFAPSDTEPFDPDGILSYTWELADDGRYAIVEFVAANKEAFRNLLADKRVLRTFEKGKAAKAEIETELRKFQRDYRLEKEDALRRAR
jgi:hypothetical protein